MTCLGWILFRVNQLSDAQTLLVSLFHWTAPASPEVSAALQLAFLVAPIFFLDLIRERRVVPGQIFDAPFWVRANAVVYLTLMLLFWSAHENIPFIYFQF